MFQLLYAWRKSLRYLLTRKFGGTHILSEHNGSEEKNLSPFIELNQPIAGHFTD
jgi:hypothetical protein